MAGPARPEVGRGTAPCDRRIPCRGAPDTIGSTRGDQRAPRLRPVRPTALRRNGLRRPRARRSPLDGGALGNRPNRSRRPSEDPLDDLLEAEAARGLDPADRRSRPAVRRTGPSRRNGSHAQGCPHGGARSRLTRSAKGHQAFTRAPTGLNAGFTCQVHSGP